MKTYIFKKLLQKSGWEHNVAVEVDSNGLITSIGPSTDNNHNGEEVNGFAIPTFYNAHSHAFQYAMAGLAERHSTTEDHGDFWSWRHAMYQLALSISPDELQAIATQLYAEMVRLGYSQVAEFHYVHHDKNGNPFNNHSEMGERLVLAAKTAGIKITLVPIFYQKGGFGKEPGKDQRRFISPTLEQYLKLYEASSKSTELYHNANIALGIHSMRGVEPTTIIETINSGPKDVPFHIHIAEQPKEIEDSIAYLGKRPVEWLCDNANLSNRFQLVHATHLTDSEVKDIASSGAQVVICPTTEGNLGDGIFPLRRFHELNGNWCIGTDSHVSLNPFEELRLLDYGQRLISHRRNTFTSSTEGNSAHFGIDMALKAGKIAGNETLNNYFEVGQSLDALVIKENVPLLSTCSDNNLLNSILYSSDPTWNKGTIIDGKWIVKDSIHMDDELITKDFANTIINLKNR